MYTRHEIPGRPVKVTTRRGASRILPTKDTVWDGLHIVEGGGRRCFADRSILHDGGDMGCGLTFTQKKKVKP